MSDLVPLRPQQFILRPTPNPAMGSECELARLPLAQLYVDTRYQRDILDNGKTNIRRIIEGFDWKKFGVLVVGRRGPNTFAIVDATTQGGPGRDTAILVYKVYHDGFKAMDMGGSAAQSVVLMVIVVVLTVIQFRYVEKKVQY